MTPPCEANTSLTRASRTLSTDSSALGLSSSRSCCHRLGKCLVDPRRLLHKYSLLTLLCMFLPGPYFYDSMFSTYRGPIMERMDLSSTLYGVLMALSAITGIVCGPAYAIVAWLGRTKVALASGFICSLSSFMVVLAVSWKSFIIVLIFRLLFWSSLYCIMIAQTVLVYNLFTGRELDVAYGFVVTSCRFGGVCSFFFSGPLLARFNNDVLGPLYLAVVSVFFTFASTVLFAILFRGTRTSQAVRPLLANIATKRFSLSRVHDVPRSVALLSLSLGCLYGTVFCFEVIADDLLQRVFGYDADNAGYLLTAAPGVSLISPLIAPWLGVSLRQKLTSACAGMLMLSTSMLLLASELEWCPVPAFFILGFGYSISVTTLFTSLPVIVKLTVPNNLVKDIEGLMSGATYGIIGCAQCISNLIVGMILERGSYRYACIYFAGTSGLGALCICASYLTKVPVVDNSSAPQSQETFVEVISNQLNSPRIDENHFAT
eukprot:TRINITY_DN22805_c0_g1_i1.p1 TRINITY_DN22805_c0_g1~~TRINITY_DN22805_c0_g1_i1.p1  ORF type:complete len:489 (+),score=53.68 TRINITY_DN22805_c0_g1_i1:104-1570(+)